MNTLRILILEDDLQTISALTDRIGKLEEKLEDRDIAVTVLSEYTQVEEYINKTSIDFDVILLDRDCKACGSFHCLEIEKIGAEKIISISSVPKWNEEAEKRKVRRSILKDYDDMEKFADSVIEEITGMIDK